MMNEFSKIFENATRKLNRGKFRKAIIGFKECLRLNQEDQLKTLNKLAHAYNGVGEYEEAIKMSNTALNLNSHSKEALNNLFYAYDQIENFDEVLKIVKKYIDIYYNDLEGSLKSHENYYQFLIKIRFTAPHKASQLFQKMFKEDYESASIEHFVSLIYPTETINVNLEESFRFTKIGWSVKRVDVLEMVLERFPSCNHLRNSLGIGYINNEAYDKAESVLEKALEIDPEDPFTWNNMGILYVKINEFQKAINAFEQVLKLHPRPESDKIRKLFEDFFPDYYQLKDNLFNKDAWVKIGNTYNKMSEYKKAISACINALKISSRYMEHYKPFLNTKIDIIGSKAWMNLSVAYRGLGDNKNAFKSLKKSLKCNKYNILSWKNLGNIHYKAKDFKRSRKAFKRVVELDPDDFEPWYDLARSFFKEGNLKNTNNAVNRSLTINPQFEPALELQKKLSSYK